MLYSSSGVTILIKSEECEMYVQITRDQWCTCTACLLVAVGSCYWAPSYWWSCSLGVSSKQFIPTDCSWCSYVKSNLVIIVSRILTQYIHDLSPLSKSIPKHILHKYCSQMSRKSEVVVLDVLMKNEAKHSDMLDIVVKMQEYLGKKYLPERRVASGGDQPTCQCSRQD